MGNCFFTIELEILSMLLLFFVYGYHKKLDVTGDFGLFNKMYITGFFASVFNIVATIAEKYGSALAEYASFMYGVCVIGFAVLWIVYALLRCEIAGTKNMRAWRIGAIAFVVIDCVLFLADIDVTALALAVCILAFLCVALVSLVGKKKLSERGKEERNKLVFTALPLLICALAQMLLCGGMMVITFGMALSIVLILVDGQYKKAVIDKLTEIPNRYGMDEEIAEQLEQYEKDNSDSFYVIACDMDSFKQINDKWGHDEGDRALKIVAQVLESVADKYDAVACRNGGDEFFIITDQADEGVVENICREAEEAFAKVHFRDDFELRISMGAAKYDGMVSIVELFKRADMTLYDVKRERKHQR